MSQENVEIIGRCFDLLNREGVDALHHIDEFCDPDVEWRAAGRLPDVDPIRGREALKAWFEEVLGTLDTRFEVHELVDAGDEVVVVFRQVSRGRASGAELTMSAGFVFGFQQGKITWVEGYRTKRQALEAAGLSE